MALFSICRFTVALGQVKSNKDFSSGTEEVRASISLECKDESPKKIQFTVGHSVLCTMGGNSPSSSRRRGPFGGDSASAAISLVRSESAKSE